MSADEQLQFHSVLGPLMERFVEEKRACGFRYRSSAQLLASFDRFLSHEAVSTDELPWAITQKWLAKQHHESVRTQQSRISIVRQFTQFMCRQGYRADVPERSLGKKKHGQLLTAHPDAYRGGAAIICG